MQVNGKTFAVDINSGHADQGDAANLENFRQYYRDVDDFFIVMTETTVARKIGSVRILNLADFLRQIGL